MKIATPSSPAPLKAGLAATLAACLVLAGCERPAAPASAPAAAPPKAAATPAAALTPGEAFRIAFGRPAPARREVTRAPENGGDATYVYDPGKLVPIDADTVALVSDARNLSDCHACSGATAVHYLKRGADGRWTLAGAWPEILGGNGFGAPATWRVRDDLGVPLMIQAEAGWTGQGYTCGSADLLELTPTGPKLRARQIPLHTDNEGVGREGEATYNVDGKIGRGPDGKLRVTYTGTKTGQVDYEMVGEAYTRVAGPSDIANC